MAPAPVLAQELNNTAVVRGVSRSLAERVRTEIVARGLEVPAEWLAGIELEVQFWFGFFATDGVEYGGLAAIERLTRPRPFQYEELFGGVPDGAPVSVLDVGAGPLSQIGTKGRRLRVLLRAADPLAPAYDVILGLFRVSPPVATEFGLGERLIGQFPEAAFDLAHARNALDHSVDPLRCIHEMSALVRPGGWVVLDHADREGDHQRFQGLHKWNFEIVDGHYCIEDARRQVRVFDHVRLGFAMRFEHYLASGKQYTRVYFQRPL